MDSDVLAHLAAQRGRARDEQQAGRLENAAAVLRRAMAAADPALGPEHVELAITLHQLAEVNRAQRRFRAAEDDYRRAVSVLTGALGGDHVAVRAVRADYADLLVELGRDHEASLVVVDRH